MLANVTAGDGLIILLVAAILLILPIVGVVHAACTPSYSFRGGTQGKGVWIAVMAVGFLLPPLGVIAALLYLTLIRPTNKRLGAGVEKYVADHGHDRTPPRSRDGQGSDWFSGS